MSEHSQAVQLAYHCLLFLVDADVSRDVAERALDGAPKLAAGMSFAVRAAALERFEPDRDPVPFKDYLPEHAEGDAPELRSEEDRYFLTVSGAPETEVSKERYVAAERSHGFHNSLGMPDEPATSSFGSGVVSGRIAYGRRMGVPERTIFTHCNWVGGCDTALSDEDGSLLCAFHRAPDGLGGLMADIFVPTCPSDVANLLRAKRCHEDHRQADLAEVLGTCQSAISDWETGADLLLSSAMTWANALGYRIALVPFKDGDPR